MNAEQPANRQPGLLEVLHQQGRVLETRMLPEDGALTDDQIAEVTDALKVYIAKHGITQREIARQIGGIDGKKETTISQVLSGKYGARVTSETRDKHVRELCNWMEVDARRRATLSDRKYVETGVATVIMTLAEQAVAGQFMAVGYGPTGIGKTRVAHALRERYPAAIYLRVSTGDTRHNAMRARLAVELSVRDPRAFGRDRRRPTYDEMVFNALRDSGRLLVIDEAHRLANSALEFLRDVHDECHVPILLLATKDLMQRLENDKDEDHGQLFSRIALFVDIVGDADRVPGGKKPLFTIPEIKRLYESDKVRLTPDAQRYLQSVANMLGHGSLRRCDWIVKWAIALERRFSNLGPEDRVTLDSDALEKAERDAMKEKGMIRDIDHRIAVAV